MTLSMKVTLKVFGDEPASGRVLAKSTLKQFGIESLGVDFSTMSDDEIQSYLTPTDEDYVLVPTRMLSAGPVQNDTINFGHEDGRALKEACLEGLFNDLLILKNHDFDVDGWLGKTQNSFWDASTPNVPPGVTGMMRLDSKADPKVCRGVISGVLDSVSVTIGFEHVKSHPKMTDTDFYMKLGEVVDGKTVQALVTKVNRVYELSVVWKGADPGAKTHTQSHSQQFTQEVSVDPKKLALALGLTLGENPTEESITLALQAHFKTSLEATQALATLQIQATAAETAKTELTAQVTALTTDLATKVTELAAHVTEIATLKASVEPLQANAKLGVAFLKTTRDEALRLYNLVEGAKATTALQGLISSATLEVAQSFVTTYHERAEQIAPLKCTKCGCTELSRATAQQNGEEHESLHTHEHQGKAETARLKTSVNSIHGE